MACLNENPQYPENHRVAKNGETRIAEFWTWKKSMKTLNTRQAKNARTKSTLFLFFFGIPNMFWLLSLVWHLSTFIPKNKYILGCDIEGAKELGVIYFPTNWGAKEPQNLPNHRVVITPWESTQIVVLCWLQNGRLRRCWMWMQHPKMVKAWRFSVAKWRWDSCRRDVWREVAEMIIYFCLTDSTMLNHR